VRDENSDSNADVTVIPSQFKVTKQILLHCLKTEMAGLEFQEEDAPKRILFFKPMSWLGQIRTHRRDESWSASLWKTFFSVSMGAQIPVIAEKPLATCGCRKQRIRLKHNTWLKAEVRIVETFS
jgi:hypothetical protein